MDIKKELEDIIEPTGNYETQWQSYKKQFEENEFTVKTEQDNVRNCTDCEEKSTFQDSPGSLGSIKDERDFNCEEKKAGNTFRVKQEHTDDQKSSSDDGRQTSQGDSKKPICKFDESSHLTIQNGDRIKKGNPSDEVDDSATLGCGAKRNFRSNCLPVSTLVAKIILKKASFFKRNFVCCVCYGFFAKAAELELHVLVHKPSVRRSTKSNRDKLSKSKYLSSRHRAKAHPKNTKEKDHSVKSSGKLLKCDQCDYTSVHFREMKIHKLLHSGKTPFECDDCSYVTHHSGHMNLHKKTHSGERSIKCQECAYSCFHFSDMKKHKMIHSGEKPFKCEDCSYSCRRSDYLKKHEMIHSGEKPFKCDECDYRCIQRIELKKHKWVHSREKPFKCDQCDYSCIYSYYMKKHKMVHSGEKPFKCDKCEYSCIQSSIMKKHKTIHTGVKPFKCDHCDYSCIHSTVMKTHKMIHSGEKPFKCDVCEFSCIHSSVMKKHKMIHSGEKPFKCGDCDFSCIHAITMKKHKTKHSGK